MIKENTVFILGAGASRLYGYPTGFELRRYICRHFSNEWIRYYRNKQNPDKEEENRSLILEFRNAFSKSLNKSIDLFLTRNKKFEKIGKIAIAHNILKAESESKNPPDFLNESDWISYLFHELTKEYTDGQNYTISANKIAFITFNYDRLLENSLYIALKNSFTSVNRAKIIEDIKKLTFFHIYGKIADLNWEDEIHGLSYKTNIEKIYSPNYIDNIQVLYDQREVPNRDLIDNVLKEAKRIFFLGFGYADENLEVLNLIENFNKYQRIFGTAKDLSKNEIQKIKEKLNSRANEKFYNELIIEECDCLTLLRNYL